MSDTNNTQLDILSDFNIFADDCNKICGDIKKICEDKRRENEIILTDLRKASALIQKLQTLLGEL